MKCTKTIILVIVMVLFSSIAYAGIIDDIMNFFFGEQEQINNAETMSSTNLFANGSKIQYGDIIVEPYLNSGSTKTAYSLSSFDWYVDNTTKHFGVIPKSKLLTPINFSYRLNKIQNCYENQFFINCSIGFSCDDIPAKNKGGWCVITQDKDGYYWANLFNVTDLDPFFNETYTAASKGFFNGTAASVNGVCLTGANTKGDFESWIFNFYNRTETVPDIVFLLNNTANFSKQSNMTYQTRKANIYNFNNESLKYFSSFNYDLTIGRDGTGPYFYPEVSNGIQYCVPDSPDLSIFNRNGTSVVGQSLYWDGTMDCTENVATNGYRELTLSTWVRIDTGLTINTNYALVALNNEVANTKTELGIKTNSPSTTFIAYFIVRNGTGTNDNAITNYTTNLAVNTWYHIVGTWNSTVDGKPRIYIDNVLRGTSAKALINTKLDNNVVSLFAYIVGSYTFTKGWQDDTSVWNISFYPDEVDRLYRDNLLNWSDWTKEERVLDILQPADTENGEQFNKTQFKVNYRSNLQANTACLRNYHVRNYTTNYPYFTYIPPNSDYIFNQNLSSYVLGESGINNNVTYHITPELFGNISMDKLTGNMSLGNYSIELGTYQVNITIMNRVGKTNSTLMNISINKSTCVAGAYLNFSRNNLTNMSGIIPINATLEYGVGEVQSLSVFMNGSLIGKGDPALYVGLPVSSPTYYNITVTHNATPHFNGCFETQFINYSITNELANCSNYQSIWYNSSNNQELWCSRTDGTFVYHGNLNVNGSIYGCVKTENEQIGVCV